MCNIKTREACFTFIPEIYIRKILYGYELGATWLLGFYMKPLDLVRNSIYTSIT